MLKNLVRTVVTSRPVLQSWQRLRPPYPCILNLHRFALPEGQGDPTGEAIPADLLRAQLAALREFGCDVVPLRDLAGQHTGGRSRKPRIAITVDDGYEDFSTVGAPVFAEYGCPVTVFLVSGFLDGTTWCWWDQLTEVLLRTPRDGFSARVGGEVVAVSCRSRSERLDAAQRLNGMLERVADETKWEALRSIAAQAEVALPAMPPAWCRPMSWDMVRAWAREGVRFGPHTVTHPILAQTSAKQCRYEMAQSWQRLKEELPDPEPIFAFPNGKDYAAGEREARMAADIGMVAALSTERRSLQPRDLDGSVALARYRLPRHAWPSSVPGLLQAVFGLEDLKDGLRRRWAVA